MLFQLSKTTGLVAGLSIALSLLGAQAAQAAQFFDFTVTYEDGSIGSGSFSIDDTPDATGSYGDGYYRYSYESWSLSDLTYTYLGQTYTNSPASGYTFYEYPDGGFYSGFNGSSGQGLSFYTDNYGSYVSLLDTVNNSGDNGYAYFFSTDTSDMSMTSVAITERTTETQSVPEPGTIAGLALTGVGFLATRRKKRSAAAVLEKAVS